MIQIEQKVWDEMIEHSRECYPNESCGLLVGPKGRTHGTRFHICKNIYDEMHAREPKVYPRTARTAYLIDGRVQQAIFVETEQQGLAVKSIVHSHTDHDAYFSEEDKTVAAPWGEPMYPEISYIVLSIWDGKFKEANEFIWSQEKKDFMKFLLKKEE